MQAPAAVRRQTYRVGYRILEIYWFVRRPTVEGVKCVLTDGELVLLVRHTYGRPGWDLPGGGMKRGESPTSAAQREMREELGVSIEDWVAAGRIFTTAFRRRDTIHCLRSELRAPSFSIDRGEIESARWFPHDALPLDVARLADEILSRVGPAGT